MNSEIRSKIDVYKALGYTALLVASAIPFSILGMQVLNFVLGSTSSLVDSFPVIQKFVV